MNGAGKKLWGYYPTDEVWIPLQVDANGKVIVDLSAVNLDDLADVSVAAPTDGYVVYWDNATSLWKCKAPIFTKIADADADTSWDVEESTDKDEVVGKVKGVEFFRGRDDGIVTLAKQSGARGWLNGDQTGIVDSTWTKINLNAETFDVQGEFNTSNYKFTAKKAGVYLAVAALMYKLPTVDQAVYYCSIWKNGAHYSSTLWASSGATQISTLNLDQLSLAANDYLELYAYHKAGVNQTARGLEQATFLAVQKVA